MTYLKEVYEEHAQKFIKSKKFSWPSYLIYESFVDWFDFAPLKLKRKPVSFTVLETWPGVRKYHLVSGGGKIKFLGSSCQTYYWPWWHMRGFEIHKRKD